VALFLRFFMTKPAAPDQPTVLMRNNGSSVRVLTIVAFAFAVGSAVLATLLLDRSGQDAHLIPWEERLLWASGLCFTFTGFFLATWMYERRIATHLLLLNNGRDLQVSTPTLFGVDKVQFPVSAIEETRLHQGDRLGEEAGAASWVYVKVKGHRSFVVSLEGVIPNRAQLLRVLNTNH
jgi:hypothetical protein